MRSPTSRSRSCERRSPSNGCRPMCLSSTIGRGRWCALIPHLAHVRDDRRSAGDCVTLSRRGASRAIFRGFCCHPQYGATTRTRKPTCRRSASPSIFWPARSAPRRRGWCCRSCSGAETCRDRLGTEPARRRVGGAAVQSRPLQSALDQVRHGLCVFDKDMRLICWNRQYRELLNLPPDLGRVGVPLDKILRFCADRGDFGRGLGGRDLSPTTVAARGIERNAPGARRGRSSASSRSGPVPCRRAAS